MNGWIGFLMGKWKFSKRKNFRVSGIFFFFLLVEVDEKRIPIVIRVNHLGADSLFE